MARSPYVLAAVLLLLLTLVPADAKTLDSFANEYRKWTDRVLDIQSEFEKAIWDGRTNDARRLLAEARSALAEQQKAADRYMAFMAQFVEGAKARPAVGIGGGTAAPPTKPPTGPVGDALAWLARNQHAEGYWDCDGHGGYQLYDPGVTGLALLTFLGAGQTHKAGAYRATVKGGLKYLKQVQDPEGCFGPRTTNRFTYNHAVATAAMCEAYALTGSPLFKHSAQQGLDFIEKCRNPYLAWRYGVRPQDNDTSVTAWMVMALAAGRAAGGLRVPDDAFEGARNWLEKATEPEYGRVGYTSRGSGPARPQDIMDRFPPDRSEALTAMGLGIRLLGEDMRSEIVRKGVDLCLAKLPGRMGSGSTDMIYWFHGTQALRRIGGAPWATWRAAMRQTALASQRKDGDLRGSWDHSGVWGREGGRVYATALMAMALHMSEQAGAPAPAKRVESAAALDKPVTLDLVRVPLGQAVASISRLAGMPVLLESGVKEIEVTLAVRDLKLRAVLDLVAAYADLEWRVDGGKIRFRTR